jgi:hypothetical protein
MHQSGRPVSGWRETLALPRPQKIIRPAHTPLKSDFYNKICHKRTHAPQQNDCSLLGCHCWSAVMALNSSTVIRLAWCK